MKTKPTNFIIRLTFLEICCGSNFRVILHAVDDFGTVELARFDHQVPLVLGWGQLASKNLFARILTVTGCGILTATVAQLLSLETGEEFNFVALPATVDQFETRRGRSASSPAGFALRDGTAGPAGPVFAL